MRELTHGGRRYRLLVGSDSTDVTPRSPVFLYGYPHVPRISTGVHDPLLASAMFVGERDRGVLFISVDTIWLSKCMVADARSQIAAQTGLPQHHLMITATHTHSGPVTVPMLSNAADAVVPPPDPGYLRQLVAGIVTAAVHAYRRAEPAEIAFVSSRCADIGGNRHDPLGPTITEVPIVAARSVVDPTRWLGLMYVNRVHPTVLHEDSTLLSADFPGACRTYLQTHLLGRNCPVLCHLGAAGDQSPRHVVRHHTFAESERIGNLLGCAIEKSLTAVDFTSELRVRCESVAVDLPPRHMPSVEASANLLQLSTKRLDDLSASGADYGLIRTAQCDVFGAEETMCLSRADAAGELRSVQQSCLPAEIQLIRIGDWTFVGWSGEVFVEFAMRVRQQHPEAFVITLANGELQGYVVTAEAVQSNWYEASNAIFASPKAGEILVSETLALLARPRSDSGMLASAAEPDSHP